MKKLLKFGTLDTLSHIVNVAFGIWLAREFGVVIKGEVAQLRLFYSLVYSFLFSGFRYNFLKENEIGDLEGSKKINFDTLNSFFIIVFCISLILAGIYSKSILMTLLAYFFTITEIYNVKNIRKSEFFKSFLALTLPNVLVFLLLVLFVFDGLVSIVITGLPLLFSGIYILFFHGTRFNWSLVGLKDVLSLNFINIISAFVSSAPMLFLSNKVVELGLFSMATGFTLIVIKVARFISITSYDDTTFTKLFTTEIKRVTLAIFVFVIFIFFIVDDLIMSIYGFEFESAIIPSRILLLSSVLLPVNARLESICVNSGNKFSYNLLTLGLAIVFLPLFFLDVNAVSVASCFFVYRILLSILGYFYVKSRISIVSKI